jgi:hypothetical protein
MLIAKSICKLFNAAVVVEPVTVCMQRAMDLRKRERALLARENR